MRTTSVVFAADARPEVGGGHMSRCISLARALLPSCDVAFALGPDAAPHWRDRLGEERIGIVDSRECVAAVAVLDGYDLQQPDVADWKRKANSLVLIEDLGRRFAGVDLYVAFAGPSPADARVLAGPQYALLGPQYARPVQPLGGGILVTCGLRDSASLAVSYLDALAQCATGGKTITVALGKTAPHRDAVEQRLGALGARVLFDAPDMAALYDEADLVLGAGGVSLFERMGRGRASVTVVAAENQVFAAEKMAAAGGTLLLGDVKQLETQALARSIATLLGDRDRLEAMGACARRIVDGGGAERVAREILALASARAQSAPAAANS